MKRKYKVSARDSWHKEHKDRFGKEYSEHELSAEEVVDIIVQFGRATITPGTIYSLSFENGYD